MIPAWPAAAWTLLITAVLIALAVEPAHAQSGGFTDASTAETSEAGWPLLLDVTLNGLQAGVLPFIEAHGRILIPAQTSHALRIRNNANEVLDPATIALVSYELNRKLGTISFNVPASQLTTLTLGSDLVPAPIALSPETTGVLMNYDITARKYSGNQHSSTDYGGLAVVQAFAPDFIANSGWAYQSPEPGASSAPIRLDSFMTWRPAARSLAVSVGDALSTPGATARPFRFIGISAGTDHSAEPGWSSRPIASIAGTAQPASSIDLYVNGVKRARLPTAGGPFNLILPPGNYTDATRVVVTDLTGRVVEIPLNPPRFNLDLVQEHMLLWSTGLGRPRFSWGSHSNDYLESTYGYGNLRYGISNQMTLTNHAEAGPGLTEIEAGIKAAVTARLGLSGSIAHSRTTSGRGAFAEAGTVMAMADNLFFSANYGRTFGEFHDAVSWSARAYDREHGAAMSLTDLPRRSSFDTRVSWEALDWLTLSSSYQRFTYQDKSAISFSALSAQANIGSGATAYLTASSSYDDVYGNSIGINMGISFLLGARLNGSVSATRQDGEYFGQAQLARPLGQERGSYGWRISESSTASGTYVNSEAKIRTGSGIPALGYTHFSGQSQTYLNAAGAAGLVAGHPFTSDPVHGGGIIIVDVGQPNVPLLLNGYEATRSRRDGLAAIPAAVAGTPQHIEIDDSNLPLSTIAGNTLQIVTIRAGGGSVAHFGVRSSATGAIIVVRVNGSPPTAGSNVLTAAGAIPVDKNGRAWIPALDRDAVLVIDLPDRRQCSVRTEFDGKGGPGRIIGPLDCRFPE
jgi:outer membrane usher protein